MKRGFFAALFATILLAMATLSFAQMGEWHGGIRARVDEAQRRIDQGIEQGSLTRNEARRLHQELGDIMEQLDRMRSDGRLDDRERDIINSRLDRLEQDIYREKHDDQAVGGFDDGPGWHDNIRARVDKAQRRIERGMEDGTLTRHEARRLQEEFGAILEKIDAMSRDGRLDRREREIINGDLDRLEMDITMEKRDDQRRPY